MGRESYKGTGTERQGNVQKQRERDRVGAVGERAAVVVLVG